MKQLTFLALVAAALVFPTLASAHDSHRGWHGRGHGHVGVFVPAPVYYAPRPVYYAPPCPQPVYYSPAPAYYGPPAPTYYGRPVVAVPAPVIAIRTPHVAVSIGGWFPF